jgi:hypothetical protein
LSTAAKRSFGGPDDTTIGPPYPLSIWRYEDPG